jgi:16S rRNA processing protein RimM
VWVRTFTREAAAIAGYGPLVDDTGRCFSVRVVAVDGDRARVRIVGIEDRTAAEALNGVRLHVPRRALPPPAEDEFYHADLIGLAVRFVDPAAADPAAADPAAARPAGGRVTAVADHGAGTVLEVTPDDGGPVILVPFSRAAVPEVDLAGGFLAVAWLPGLAADPGAGG